MVGLRISLRLVSQGQQKKNRALYNKERTEYEKKAYGLSEDTPAADRPIYGYYAQKNDSKSVFLHDYGKVSVQLKDSVKSRSTFTDSDSLDLNVGGYSRLYPSPATKPSIYSTYGISNHTEVISANKSSWITYWEAQIFGGVKVSDIKKVRFFETPKKGILKKLDKLKIKYDISSTVKK